MKRITARLRQAVELRRKHRRILNRVNANGDEILEGIQSAKKVLRRKKQRLRKLRDEDRRHAKRDELADHIEELEALIDRLTERAVKKDRKSDRLRAALERDRKRIERLRKRRQEIKASLGDLTAHFAMAEFNCREGGPVPDYMKDDLKGLSIRVLEKMRAKFGAAHVNSGHRWHFYNVRIGGASGSYHVYEDRKNQPAADLIFVRGRPSEWAAYARSLGVGGVGQYSSFVHVDTGARRDWWG